MTGQPARNELADDLIVKRISIAAKNVARQLNLFRPTND
jgi:hypothetical protein